LVVQRLALSIGSTQTSSLANYPRHVAFIHSSCRVGLIPNSSSVGTHPQLLLPLSPSIIPSCPPLHFHPQLLLGGLIPSPYCAARYRVPGHAGAPDMPHTKLFSPLLLRCFVPSTLRRIDPQRAAPIPSPAHCSDSSQHHQGPFRLDSFLRFCHQGRLLSRLRRAHRVGFISIRLTPAHSVGFIPSELRRIHPQHAATDPSPTRCVESMTTPSRAI
jgi:hypothetical protein